MQEILAQVLREATEKGAGMAAKREERTGAPTETAEAATEATRLLHQLC